MNITDLSHQQSVGPEWKILGEIELTANAETDITVGNWLTIVCSPLRLQSGVVHKLLNSARESIARTLQAESVRKCEHVHILIFAPAERAVQSGTWGFFRIERVDDSSTTDGNRDHAIEFYLYLDGGNGG